MSDERRGQCEGSGLTNTETGRPETNEDVWRSDVISARSVMATELQSSSTPELAGD